MIRAQVIIRPRASIFDPQGDAVQRAIAHLGVATVKQAHVGKFIELEVDTDDATATRAELETICRDLLSNPVIEDYVLTLDTDRVQANAAVISEILRSEEEEEVPPSELKIKAKPKAKTVAKKTAKKIKLTKAKKKAEKKAAKKAAKLAKKKAKKLARAQASKKE